MTLWSSVRAAVSSTTDALGRFMLANLVWLVAATLAVTAGATFRPGYVLSVLVIPITCGIARMAGHAVRKDFPRYRNFRDGVRHRWGVHLALGTAQGLLLVMAVINLGVGMGGESLLFALIAVLAGWVALGTGVLAVAVWPLLLDPRRHAMRVPAVLRLALAVVARRPLGLVVIALIEAVLFAVIAQFVPLGVFLPSLGVLVAAHYVLPVADELQQPRGAVTAGRRSARGHG